MKYALKKRDVFLNAILVFLCHLSLGLPSTVLGILFSLSSSTCRGYIRRIRELIYQSQFAKQWLRFPRNIAELRNWTPDVLAAPYIAKNNVLLCTFDCTYVWLQQSTDVGKTGMRRKINSDQYNGQPFVKFLTCAAPNGRMIFVYGPFPASASDNSILYGAIVDNQDLHSFLSIAKRNGIVLVDRGFNHTDQVFEKAGIPARYRIPGWTDNEGKFSAIDIVVQYEITSARAVVEQAHAMWRKFRWFSHEVPLTQVPPLITNKRSPLKDYVITGFVLSNFFYNPPRSTSS